MSTDPTSALPSPPPIDPDALIDKARQRLQPGLLLSLASVGVVLLGVVLSGLLASTVLGMMLLDLGPGSSPSPSPMPIVGMQVGMLFVLVVICVGVACAQAVPLWMASRLRSREWIVGAGVVSIVGPMVQTLVLMCSQGGCGCLLAPVALGLGIAGGTILIASSQHPTVLAGLEARSRLDAAILLD